MVETRSAAARKKAIAEATAIANTTATTPAIEIIDLCTSEDEIVDSSLSNPSPVSDSKLNGISNFNDDKRVTKEDGPNALVNREELQMAVGNAIRKDREAQERTAKARGELPVQVPRIDLSKAKWRRWTLQLKERIRAGEQSYGITSLPRINKSADNGLNFGSEPSASSKEGDEFAQTMPL